MKIRIPLVKRTVAGFPCPEPVVRLWVRDRYGALAAVVFRVDSQADLTTIPIQVAEREGIPFSSNHLGTAYGLVGAIPKFRDRVRLRIAGRDHEWPCDFVTSPAPQPDSLSFPVLTPVLGRAGFLAEYAATIDSGFLVLTRLGPLRRWWRRCLHAVWRRFGLIHTVEEPL
jgi:hypothetical protein